MKIVLGLEYDGSRFCGWQSQPSACGVQDALERALADIAGDHVRVTAAGRTDAGVHACAQVVHFDAPAARPESAWVRGVNSGLPAGVSVLWAQPVGEEFHARFSARARCYRYLLLNHPLRPGLEQGRVGWFHRPLDLDRMREAACHLLGTHDFSAFRSAECQARSPVRTVFRLELLRQGDLVLFDVWANAFLHHMVRNLIGCLVEVGKGARLPNWARQVLEGRERRLAAPTFAAEGLYFAAVRYAGRWGLPQVPGRSTLFLGWNLPMPELIEDEWREEDTA